MFTWRTMFPTDGCSVCLSFAAGPCHTHPLGDESAAGQVTMKSLRVLLMCCGWNKFNKDYSVLYTGATVRFINTNPWSKTCLSRSWRPLLSCKLSPQIILLETAKVISKKFRAKPKRGWIDLKMHRTKNVHTLRCGCKRWVQFFFKCYKLKKIKWTKLKKFLCMARK